MRAIYASLLAFALLGAASAEARPGAAQPGSRPAPAPGTPGAPKAPGSEPERLGASGPTAAELAAWAAQLRAADEARREQASRRLATLPPESLPGIGQRLDALLAPGPDPEARRKAFTALRHAAGSRRLDDDADLLKGVTALLAERRDPEAGATAEALLLLRSLEGLASREAGRLIARYATAHDGQWRNELRLLRARAGRRLLPALLELRSHGDVEVRRWAQYGVRALDMAEPSTLAELDDPLLLADAVRAYAEPLDFPAMPTLVRLVDHDNPEVRRAARDAVRRFGKNAIWQLRELYEELSGERADRSWGHEQTAQRLYALIDRERNDELQRLLDRGMAAFVDGRLDDMAREFDLLLARAPAYPERAKLAPAYAALGAHRLQIDDLSAARSAYRRALRLAPDAAEAASWRAQLEFATAEQRLSRGLLDLDAYAHVQALDPQHAAAAEAIDLLSGAKAERERRNKRAAATLAALLLLALAITLWRGRPPNDDAPAEPAGA